MIFLTSVFLFQLAAPGRPVTPVLAFPEPGLDDTAAYQGYRTRFFKDFAGNTVQIYVDNRSGRVVHLLADAENESIGFTARGADGRLVPIDWGSGRADVFGGRASAGGSDSRSRTLVHQLEVDARQISVGWFLLG